MDDRCNDSLDVECLKLYVWHWDGVDCVDVSEDMNKGMLMMLRADPDIVLAGGMGKEVGWRYVGIDGNFVSCGKRCCGGGYDVDREVCLVL